MAYWTYIDDETKAQLTLCDFADLAPFAAESARERLRNAYGDPDDDTPDFEAMETYELDSWCEDFCILFGIEDGSLHWTDEAESVTQIDYEAPGDDHLFSFADLRYITDGLEAQREAVYWMFDNVSSHIPDDWKDADPETIPLEDMRGIANYLDLVFDGSGAFGYIRTDCSIRNL